MTTSSTHTPLQTLQFSVEALRVQIQSNPAAEGVASDMLSGILRRSRSVFTALFDRKVDGTALTGLQADYAREDSYKHLKATDYPLLARQPLDGMEGFTGLYVDYTPVVLRGLKFYEDQLDEALKFYRLLAGSLVNNRASRESWEDLTPRFEKSAEYRAREDKGNAEFWVAGSHEAVTKVGNVVSRLADLQQLDKDGEDVRAAIRGYDLKKIEARVTEINDLVQVISKGIETSKMLDLSRAQVANLANGIMELAYQTEHFAVAVYRAHMYLNALKRLQAVVKAYH